MNYIRRSTGVYPVTRGQILGSFPNTSFPRDDEAFNAAVEGFGFSPVQPSPRPEITYLQTLTEGSPELIDGVYYQRWVIGDADQALIDDRTADKAADIRQERKRLLAESDWTQLGDSPVQPVAAWRTYRAALRDVTNQAGFPWNVSWPTAPSTLER